MIAHLLETEQHTPDRTAERHAHARSRTGTQDLPRLRRVSSILVEEPTYHIPRTHSVVHAGPLLAHTQPTRNRQRQPNALNHQRRRAQKPLHDEPRDDALHLANPTTRRIRRKALDQRGRRARKQRREEHIQHVIHGPKPAPPLPLCTPALRAPAAETLIQIKRRLAVPQLDIAQPLRDDVEKRSVEPYRRADERDYNPRLPRIIRLRNLRAPLPPPPAQEHTT